MPSAHKIKEVEDKKLDPTGTGRIRAGLRAEGDRRIAQLKRGVIATLNDDDIFSLRGPNVYAAIAGGQPADKLRIFNNSYDSMNAAAMGGAWAAPFISQGYQMGFAYGYKGQHVDAHKSNRLPVLHAAAEGELGGIAAAGIQLVSRLMTMGLQQNKPPVYLARLAREAIEKVYLPRTHTFANTVIVDAHAHGTLDGFKARGIKKVGLQPEHKPPKRIIMSDARRSRAVSEPMAVWVTAGDSFVCPECQSHEGEELTIEEARGLIPLHGNCRCIWEPIEE